MGSRAQEQWCPTRHALPPHKGGSGPGNMILEENRPKQMPQADSLYKQKVNSDETLIRPYDRTLTQTQSQGGSGVHPPPDIREAAAQQTRWSAVATVTTDGAALRVMENSTQTQDFPSPAPNTSCCRSS